MDDLINIFKAALTTAVNLFAATAEILIANPVILIATLFFGLSAGKELKIGKTFRAKG